MFLSKPSITSTIDIPDYNIIKASVVPEIYSRIISDLRKKDIVYLNSTLFIDATSFKHTHYIEILLNDKRFNINKVKDIFKNACFFGNIEVIKLLIDSDLNIKEQDFIDSLDLLMSSSYNLLEVSRFSKSIVFKKDTLTIKFLRSIFNYDKAILEKLFLSVYSFYAGESKFIQKKLNYLDFIMDLFLELNIKSNKKIMNKISNPDCNFYDKELLNLLHQVDNINKF